MPGMCPTTELHPRAFLELLFHFILRTNQQFSITDEEWRVTGEDPIASNSGAGWELSLIPRLFMCAELW